MQLLVKHSQRKGGAFGGKTIFSLNIRAQYSEEERALINGLDLGGSVIYDSAATRDYLQKGATETSNIRGFGYLLLSKMNLSITIASLQKGHQIECKDLAELVECENAIVGTRKQLKQHLEVAKTFDGREIAVDLDELVI